MLRQARSVVVRLSVHYIGFSILLVLPGWRIEGRPLLGTCFAALVYALLTVTVRRWLLALSLPLIVKTAGLFIFVVDGAILALTAALTGFKVDSVWWGWAGVLVVRVATIWAERAFRAIGWLRAEGGSAG